MLDGASHPDPTERDGGWLADTLGRDLRVKLSTDPGADLADMLAAAIADVARRYALAPGIAPSTTVNIVRWHGDDLDVLVLCDSPAVVFTRDGQAHPVRDDRLPRLTHLAPGPGPAPGFVMARPDQWRAGVARQQGIRNRPGSYWVAEADPQAAHHAIRARWPLADVDAVLALTDGVADGVDRYGHPSDWHAALRLATGDPAVLVDAVHRAEESDPDGTRWPRGKRHDDKAIAVIRFGGS